VKGPAQDISCFSIFSLTDQPRLPRLSACGPPASGYPSASAEASRPARLALLAWRAGITEKEILSNVLFGLHKAPCTAGGPMISHRDLWGALGNKDKLAYPCHQALPTHSLSDPYVYKSELMKLVSCLCLSAWVCG